MNFTNQQHFEIVHKGLSLAIYLKRFGVCGKLSIYTDIWTLKCQGRKNLVVCF